MQLPQRTESLLLLLDRMIELLEWDCHTFWLERTREAVALLRDDKRAGFTLFLSGFGTAGSFNECSVGKGEWKGNVHIWSPGHEAKYKEFESLKNESYGLARELARESEPPFFVSLKAVAARTSNRTRLLLAVLGVLLLVAVALAPQ